MPPARILNGLHHAQGYYARPLSNSCSRVVNASYSCSKTISKMSAYAPVVLIHAQSLPGTLDIKYHSAPPRQQRQPYSLIHPGGPRFEPLPGARSSRRHRSEHGTTWAAGRITGTGSGPGSADQSCGGSGGGGGRAWWAVVHVVQHADRSLLGPGGPAHCLRRAQDAGRRAGEIGSSRPAVTGPGTSAHGADNGFAMQQNADLGPRGRSRCRQALQLSR